MKNKLKLLVAFLFMYSSNSFAQDESTFTYVLGMYDFRIGDSYGLGSQSENIFIEGGYGGFFGKYKETGYYAGKDIENNIESRYGYDYDSGANTKQTNWNIAIGYFPQSMDNIYLGMNYSSMDLDAYMGSDEMFKTRDNSFDILGGIRYPSDNILFDLRVGYALSAKTKVVESSLLPMDLAEEILLSGEPLLKGFSVGVMVAYKF